MIHRRIFENFRFALKKFLEKIVEKFFPANFMPEVPEHQYDTLFSNIDPCLQLYRPDVRICTHFFKFVL